jgi:4-amino-4-deoxy-L-arabinose transferase-like glycosyltransferase
MNPLHRWQSCASPLLKTTRSKRKRGRGAVLGFFIGGLICCSIGNVVWLGSHWLTFPPPWDQAFYLYMGLRYFHALVDYGPVAGFKEFIHLSTDVAPLYPLTTMPLYLLFGPSRLVAYMTNIGYLGLLLAGIYLLGAHLYGRSAGLLAAFIAATFTATVNYSRDYLLEFPATAFVMLGMYALLRAEAFRHRAWCLALGALAGLSVLTKTMTGVFFIGPVLLALGPLVWQRQLNAAVLKNFLLAVVVGMLVAAVWWGLNFRTALGYLIYYGFQAGSVPYNKGSAGVLSLGNLSYYALHLMNHGISFLYTLLFAGLIMFVGIKAVFGVERRNVDDASEDAPVEPMPSRQALYLWAWLLAGYVILTLVPNKGEERYAQPLLPPIALLMSGAIMAIGNSWVRRTIMGLAVIIGGLNYIGLTYGLPGLPSRLFFNSVAIISHEYPHYSWVRGKIPPTVDSPWPISAILAILAELTDRDRAREIAELRHRLLATSQERSIDADVQQIYRVILRREPSKRGFQEHTTALRAGQLSPADLIDLLRATAEFRHQRAKVLVVPDHPSFNASTLRYYAEAERRPLSFFHILDAPIDAERLQMYDFVLVKSSGYQGPEFSTQYAAQIQAQVARDDSRFVLLPQLFAFPDDTHIVIFATESVLP